MRVFAWLFGNGNTWEYVFSFLETLVVPQAPFIGIQRLTKGKEMYYNPIEKAVKGRSKRPADCREGSICCELSMRQR